MIKRGYNTWMTSQVHDDRWMIQDEQINLSGASKNDCGNENEDNDAGYEDGGFA